MESPNRRRSALWDAVQDAEDRAVADFLAPACHALGLSGGADHGGADTGRRDRLQPGRRSVSVVVVPEIATRIVAAFASGTDIAALAHQWHLTAGEVSRIIAG